MYFIVGLSILIGVITGYVTSEKEYFILIHGNTMEISKIEGENAERNKSDHLKIKTTYNTSNAIAFGAGSFGALLVISSIFKAKNNQASS